MLIDPATLNRRDIHEMLVAVVMPRPIAWVSTVDGKGVFNLAPFSMYTSVCLKPPIIALCIGFDRSGRKKDTLTNLETSKDFVINIVEEDLAARMNQTSADYPPDADEFKEVGLTAAKSAIVKAPLLAESRLNMECVVKSMTELGERKDGGGVLVLGEVVCFHVKDELYVNGEIDVSKLRHVGRLGEQYYCRVTDAFRLERPYVL